MANKTFAKIRNYIADPAHHRRITIVFWTILIAPPAVLGILLLLIGLGAFGKLPTFEELENPRSNLATEVISADGRNIGNFFVENRSYVDYGDLSPNLVAALVATEDVRFYSHSGIDFLGLARVGVKTVLLGDRGQGGGSTISQQLAKNLWFSPERSLLRKIKEAIMTARLELWLDKDRILELYLNVVEWGQGIFGAEAAARHYFGKPAAALNKREAAQLAVMLPAPLKRSPRSPLVQRLSSRLMRRMY